MFCLFYVAVNYNKIHCDTLKYDIQFEKLVSYLIMLGFKQLFLTPTLFFLFKIIYFLIYQDINKKIYNPLI